MRTRVSESNRNYFDVLKQTSSRKLIRVFLKALGSSSLLLQLSKLLERPQSLKWFFYMSQTILEFGSHLSGSSATNLPNGGSHLRVNKLFYSHT